MSACAPGPDECDLCRALRTGDFSVFNEQLERKPRRAARPPRRPGEVMLSLLDPNTLVHPSTDRCPREEPHHVHDCGEWNMTEKDEDRGLYEKFTVARTDGSSDVGGKHEGCRYFVLDLTHDPFALSAALTYAVKCARAYPALATDLVKLVRVACVEAWPSAEAQVNRVLARLRSLGDLPDVARLHRRVQEAHREIDPSDPRAKQVRDLYEDLDRFFKVL